VTGHSPDTGWISGKPGPSSSSSTRQQGGVMKEADINHVVKLIYELGLEPESRHKTMCKLAWQMDAVFVSSARLARAKHWRSTRRKVRSNCPL